MNLATRGFEPHHRPDDLRKQQGVDKRQHGWYAGHSTTPEDRGSLVRGSPPGESTGTGGHLAVRIGENAPTQHHLYDRDTERDTEPSGDGVNVPGTT